MGHGTPQLNYEYEEALSICLIISILSKSDKWFNMDSFNPFQLKQASQPATVMELYMVWMECKTRHEMSCEGDLHSTRFGTSRASPGSWLIHKYSDWLLAALAATQVHKWAKSWSSFPNFQQRFSSQVNCWFTDTAVTSTNAQFHHCSTTCWIQPPGVHRGIPVSLLLPFTTQGNFWHSCLLPIMGYHILEQGSRCQENPCQVDHKSRLDHSSVKAEEKCQPSGVGRTGKQYPYYPSMGLRQAKVSIKWVWSYSLIMEVSWPQLVVELWAGWQAGVDLRDMFRHPGEMLPILDWEHTFYG